MTCLGTSEGHLGGFLGVATGMWFGHILEDPGRLGGVVLNESWGHFGQVGTFFVIFGII